MPPCIRMIMILGCITSVGLYAADDAKNGKGDYDLNLLVAELATKGDGADDAKNVTPEIAALLVELARRKPVIITGQHDSGPRLIPADGRNGATTLLNPTEGRQIQYLRAMIADAGREFLEKNNNKKW
jgi:hypothetical protein